MVGITGKGDRGIFGEGGFKDTVDAGSISGSFFERKAVRVSICNRPAARFFLNPGDALAGGVSTSPSATTRVSRSG